MEILVSFDGFCFHIISDNEMSVWLIVIITYFFFKNLLKTTHKEFSNINNDTSFIVQYLY